MNIGNLLILCVMVITALFYLSMIMYLKFGWFHKLYHDILKCHMPDDSKQTFDGCSMHATCKYCGKDIMQDSQGNWF